LARVIKRCSIQRTTSDDNAVYILDSEALSKKVRQHNRHSPKEEADLIIEEAQLRASEIISQAESEAESIRASAYEEGRLKAIHELEEQRSALEEYRKELESNAEAQLQKFWDEIEPELLKLAVDIAEKILRKEFSEHEDYVLTTVKSALYQLRDKKQVKIRVNPSDHEFVRSHKDDLISSFDGIGSLEVIEDRRVDQGGCVIESANGNLDARITTQLEQVKRALLEECHGS
jgi:flagellar assembly protein FliH